MKLDDVALLGTGMVPFGTHPDRTLLDLAVDAGLRGLADAEIDLREVGEAYCGSMLAPPMFGVRVMQQLGLTGLSVVTIENASASGLVAMREAAFAVQSGRCEIALALTYEHPLAPLRGSGGITPGYESWMAPPATFALWASRRMHDRGTRPDQLARIAAKNWNCAALNPDAHHRPDHRVTPEEVLASRSVASPLTEMMGAPAGAGAACAVVASGKLVRRRRPGQPHVYVRSASLVSEQYEPGYVALGPVVGPPSMTSHAARGAYEAAGIGPGDLSFALVHDSWAIEELEYYEQLGLCGAGEAEKLVEDGETEPTGRIPVSVEGGLIARGHPIAATGLAQVHEIGLQLTGRAGPRQIGDARIALAHLVGGGSTAIAALFERGT